MSAKRHANDVVTLTAVGDLQLGRATPRALARNSEFPVRSPVRELLLESDLIFGNLEGCFADDETRAGPPAIRKKYPIVVPESSVEILSKLHFNLLSLANNHCGDFGAPAIRRTQELLQARGMHFAGIGNSTEASKAPAIVTIKGITIGLLARSASPNGEPTPQGVEIAPLNESEILRSLQALKPSVDFLILSLHWGAEGSPEPSEGQIRMAHGFIDAGADLILGHHPHVLQRFELYQEKLIAYSLGNFIFDQSADLVSQSAILRLILEDGRPAKLEVLPVRIRNFIPEPAESTEFILPLVASEVDPREGFSKASRMAWPFLLHRFEKELRP